MRAGDLKWNGPREGLVKCLLSRNRWYFAFCLTIPPEIVMSSVRTQICIRSMPSRSSQHFRLPRIAGCFNAAGIVRTFASFPAFSSISFATHDFLAGQQLLGNDRREPAKHVVFAIDDDDLRDACSIAVPGKRRVIPGRSIGDRQRDRQHSSFRSLRARRSASCLFIPRFLDLQSGPFVSFDPSRRFPASAVPRSPSIRVHILSPWRFFRFDPKSLPCVPRPAFHRSHATCGSFHVRSPSRSTSHCGARLD